MTAVGMPGCALVCLLSVGYVVGQTAPAFEVASIRLHQGMITAVGGVSISGTSVSVPASTVGDLIGNAYGVKDFQVAGLADWMRSDRYDIVARSTGDVAPTEGQARKMLQALLEDRFQLRFHIETRDLPVFALITKGAPKLKENPGGSGIVKFNRKGREVTLVFMGAPMDSLVRQLPRMPGVDRPVLDKTGLMGKYDFQLVLADFQLGTNPEQLGIPAADSDGASVFAALQEQLGLKLETQQAPVEMLVIDHVEKPSAN